MDHMMPDMDGIEATDGIRKLGYKEPIIALTANAVAGQSEIFLQNGFDDFISKPIDVRQLNSVLNKYIRDKQPPEIINVIQNQGDNTSHNESNDGGAELDDFIKSVDRISEINTKIGLSRVSNIKNTYRSMLSMFTEKLLSRCGGMTEAMESEDMKMFLIHAHTMKTLLSTIGARQLSEYAAELENASIINDRHLCIQLFPSFKEKLLLLHGQLSKLFVGTKEDSKKEPGNRQELPENIKNALAASQNFDSDTAQEIIKNLLRFDFGAGINSMLEKTSTAFDDYNYEKAIEILEGLAKEMQP
jgi:CheY-like chemotaxis protein